MSYEYIDGNDKITFENKKDYYRAMRDYCNVNILLIEDNYIIQDVNSVGDFTGFLQDRVGSYNVIDIQKGNIENSESAFARDLRTTAPFLYNNIFINNSQTTIPEGALVSYNPIDNTVFSGTVDSNFLTNYYNNFVSGDYSYGDNSKKNRRKKVEKKVENKDDSIKDRSELLELE